MVQQGGPDFMMSVTCIPVLHEYCHCSMSVTMTGKGCQSGAEGLRERGTYLYKQVALFLSPLYTRQILQLL